MKSLLLLFTLVSSLYAVPPPPPNADAITPEYLAKVGKETGFCDYIPHMQKIFDNYKVKTLLEFGLGYSTKYFLDHCTKVISVEFITRSLKPDWIKYCLGLYQDYSNWIPVAYFSNYPGDFSWAPYKFFGTSKLYEAETQYSPTLQFPTDGAYLTELNTFITNITKYHKIDLVLVDPPTLLRGPLVELLFDKASVIVAHDCYSYYTEQITDIYGYRRVKVPDNYETIFINKGKTTLVWIKKSEETLIQLLKEYAATP
jgi:hypothetical protein